MGGAFFIFSSLFACPLTYQGARPFRNEQSAAPYSSYLCSVYVFFPPMMHRHFYGFFI
jgi:hypothetical protein